MGYIKSGFTGFITGNIIAILLSQWMFMEMRVNINLVIPLLTFAGIAVYHLKRINFQLKLLLLLEIALVVLISTLYEFNIDTFFIIPGAMFREGFFLTSFSLRGINILLFLIFIICNFIVLIGSIQFLCKKVRVHL